MSGDGAVVALSAAGIVVDRGERRVIDGLSFAVAAGDAVAVTGPNGAGKSTLLRAVAGLLPLAGGAIRLAGVEEPAEAMHLVAHHNALKLSLGAEANLAFWCAVLGGGATEAGLEDALDRVGLGPIAGTPAEFLSQGQRRRLALARLLACPRPVWLLDEPTAGLDAASRAVFAEILAEHLGGGGLALAATHEDLGVRVRELALA